MWDASQGKRKSSKIRRRKISQYRLILVGVYDLYARNVLVRYLVAGGVWTKGDSVRHCEFDAESSTHVTSLAFTCGDKPHILAASSDGVILRWNLQTGALVSRSELVDPECAAQRESQSNEARSYCDETGGSKQYQSQHSSKKHAHDQSKCGRSPTYSMSPPCLRKNSGYTILDEIISHPQILNDS